jgi:hypothetical protein
MRLDPVAHYDDGMGSPAVLNRMNPRDISNALGAQPETMVDARQLSDFTWQWGQFIDHDMTLTFMNTEPMDIMVSSPSDPLYPMIPMDRSDYDFSTGTSTSNPRAQYNENTSYLDASMVYGSDTDRALALRTFSGGLLQTSGDNLLPRNVIRIHNANEGVEPHPTLFLAGDIRANEQLGLIAMHTLFMREHNRLATEIGNADPSLNDEQIYQRARKMVGAIVQHVTYNEYLPALTGNPANLDEASYNPEVNATIANEFSTAVFRMGHTQVSPTLMRMDNDGNVAPGGPTTMLDAFFAPSRITGSEEIDFLLKGLASQIQQPTDLKMIDEMRNTLFGPPGAGGLDLFALNVNRARDHGMPTLVQMQGAAGLPVARSFAEITSDPQLQAELASVYPSAKSVDLWVGLLAEDKLPGSALGFTLQTLLLEQFDRLMSGDRFFYLWDEDLTADELDFITSSRLSDVIRRNTGLTNLQENVFFVPEPTTMLIPWLAACLVLRLRKR